MRVAVAEDVDRDSRREIQVTLALFLVVVDSLVAQPVGAAVADAVAPIEPVDLPLDIVDPRLERTHLAPIAANTIVVAVVTVVVAIRRGLRLRIILRSGGTSGDECRARGGD